MTKRSEYVFNSVAKGFWESEGVFRISAWLETTGVDSDEIGLLHE